jgi:inhibitor of KinA sporulation pathway (predicted exonuclease)
MTFEKGLSQFLGHFNRENDYLMSFGYYDIKQIFKDCQLNNIPYPFDEGNEWQYSKHINIKNALAKKLDIREKGMDSLMIHLGLKLKGRHHN